MTIIYLHGFQSDGQGSKYEALKSHFKNTEILSPDLPANPNEVKTQINNLLNKLKERGEEVLLMGTSLGGFYSLYFSTNKYKMHKGLYGRKEEIRILEEALFSPEAEMISVIGRRRVGKTLQIFWVFLSTFGLNENEHSQSIVMKSLSIDALFD